MFKEKIQHLDIIQNKLEITTKLVAHSVSSYTIYLLKSFYYGLYIIFIT